MAGELASRPAPGTRCVPCQAADVLDGGFAAGGVRHRVVVFEKRALSAAPVSADEGAPSAIALPHRPLDRRRDESSRRG